MSINRFEKIRQFFHCNNNENCLPTTHAEYDKLYKVRPVINLVLRKCKNIPQEEVHSIDEQILPTKGRTSSKQYLPKKPNKWGIKVWARCGISGVIYDFEIYTGKSTTAETKPELLMGGNVVYRLTRFLPENGNYKVFFDNIFTSIQLIIDLKNDGIWAVGTIRKDRLKGAQHYLLSEKDLKKKDKEFVHIDRPKIVEIYNAHMGGVDLCDMLLSLYRIRQRTNKVYFHVVFYCFGISVVNGWLLYRRHMNQNRIPVKNRMSLIQFQSRIADSLCRSGKVTSTKGRGRPSLNGSFNTQQRKRKAGSVPSPSIDIRSDRCDHFPQFQEKQQRCRLCKSGYSSIKCTKCDVHLCLVKATTPHKNIETNSGFTRKIDISSHMESLKFQSGNDETA